jgi:hypothetical protein
MLVKNSDPAAPRIAKRLVVDVAVTDEDVVVVAADQTHGAMPDVGALRHPNKSLVLRMIVLAPRSSALSTKSAVPPGPSPASPFHSAIRVTLSPPAARAL